MLELVELLRSLQKYMLANDVIYCGSCDHPDMHESESGFLYAKQLVQEQYPEPHLRILSIYVADIPYIYNLRYRYFLPVLAGHCPFSNVLDLRVEDYPRYDPFPMIHSDLFNILWFAIAMVDRSFWSE